MCQQEVDVFPETLKAAREIIRLSGKGAVERGRKVKMPTGMPLVFPATMARYSEVANNEVWAGIGSVHSGSALDGFWEAHAMRQ